MWYFYLFIYFILKYYVFIKAWFSVVTWPFMFKIIWAPIVDSLYVQWIGRRKTWLMPLQYLSGIYQNTILFSCNWYSYFETLTLIKFFFLYAYQSKSLTTTWLSILIKCHDNINSVLNVFVLHCNVCNQP